MTSYHADAIRPNILSLVELLEHYLEEDEQKIEAAVLDAALDTDPDAPRRVSSERSNLNMVRDRLLEVALLRRQLWEVRDITDERVQDKDLVLF